jgi:hypothetical protein
MEVKRFVEEETERKGLGDVSRIRVFAAPFSCPNQDD